MESKMKRGNVISIVKFGRRDWMSREYQKRRVRRARGGGGDRDETSRFRPFGKCVKHTRAGLYNIRIDVWRERRGRRIRIRRRRSWAEWKCRIQKLCQYNSSPCFFHPKGIVLHLEKTRTAWRRCCCVCCGWCVRDRRHQVPPVPTISQSALNKRQNSIGTRHFDVPLLLNYAIAVPPLFSFYWFPPVAAPLFQ